MERESFTSLPIAKLLNDSFVSIKVDKEERGDVDRVYMTYVQVMLMDAAGADVSCKCPGTAGQCLLCLLNLHVGALLHCI